MRRYAEDTTVSVDKSISDLRRLMQRYGATGFQLTEATDSAGVEFVCNGRQVRYAFHYPDPDDERFTLTETGRERTELQAEKAWEAECRRLWRALILIVQASFEAVDAGVATFDEVFLAHIVLPDNRTVGSYALPAMDKALTSGGPPALLASFKTGRKAEGE